MPARISHSDNIAIGVVISTKGSLPPAAPWRATVRPVCAVAAVGLGNIVSFGCHVRCRWCRCRGRFGLGRWFLVTAGSFGRIGRNSLFRRLSLLAAGTGLGLLGSIAVAVAAVSGGVVGVRLFGTTAALGLWLLLVSRWSAVGRLIRSCRRGLVLRRLLVRGFGLGRPATRTFFRSLGFGVRRLAIGIAIRGHGIAIRGHGIAIRWRSTVLHSSVLTAGLASTSAARTGLIVR